MNTTLIAAIICVCLCAAVLLGMRIRRRLPEHHFTPETKDSVTVATGLIESTGDKSAPGWWLTFAAVCGLLATLMLYRRKGNLHAQPNS